MNKIIVAISRQFGSGGRIIGERLAAELGILFYDKTIIELAAKKSGLSTDFIEKSEEHASNSFLFNLASSSYTAPSYMFHYDLPIADKAFFAQASVIKELAAKDSCVIVGRCADYILRNEPNCIKVFVHANMEDRKKRIENIYKISADEVESKINKIDKGRANYYRHYTSEKWGDIFNHDLAINTSIVGINGAVRVIKAMLKEGKYIN